MKESIRNKKDGDKSSEMNRFKNLRLFVCVYIKWLLSLVKLIQKQEFTQ